MKPEFSLDKSFWRAFTKTYWNRKPTVIRAPFSKPMVTPGEVLGGVVAAGRHAGVSGEDLDLRIGGRRIVVELDRWLPLAKDATLERYLARLKRGGEAGQLYIKVKQFQCDLGWTFYSRLRQFLQGLYEIAGVPSQAGVELFLGSYARTPTGVHRDDADVFCFVVEGSKKFRLWPAEAIRSSSPLFGPSPYENYLKGSFCLEGGPGDIIFWPSSYWHVAESEGGMGSSLSVLLFYGESVFAALTKNIREWYREIGGDERDPIGSLPLSKLQVPGILVSTAQRAEGRPGRLTERLMRSWMELITGYGFVRIPRADGPASLRRGREVRANPAFPIVHWKCNGALVIAANGRSMAVAYDREIVRMLGKVSHGANCKVTELLRTGGRNSDRVSRQGLRRTLKFLLEERALEPVGGGRD